jgi:hypothetical protein
MENVNGKERNMTMAIKMCRTSKRNKNNSKTHYWDTDTGRTIQEGDEGTEGFTSEALCPKHAK